VTGGCGFVGNALVRALLKQGKEVTVYDRLTHIKNLEDVKDQVNFVKGNILNSDLVDTMSDNHITQVYNLAASPFIPDSYYYPRKVIETNFEGALNVMMAAQISKVERVIQVSSSEVYGSASYTPMDEKHPLNPHSTYAVSKLAADRLAFTLYKEHEIPIVIVRPFNMYGPRFTQPYIIPTIIRSLCKEPKLTIGHRSARRDFTYVEDGVDALIKIMDCEEDIDGVTINIGSNKTYWIFEIIKMIQDILGIEEIDIDTSISKLRPYDVNLLQCDYGLLNGLVGWAPTTSILEGLRKTVNWYKEVMEDGW